MQIHKQIGWRGYIVPSLLLTICLFGFMPNPYIDVRLGKQIISEWCVYLFAILFFLKTKELKLFLFVIFARYVLMFMYPVYDIRISQICIKATYMTMNSIMVYCLFYEGLCRARMNKNIIYNILCILGLIQTLGMILQYFGVWLFFAPVDSGIIGMFSNPNMAGSFLAIITPCFFRKKWLFAFPVIVIGLLLSKTEGAIVPVVLFVMVYCYFKIHDNFKYLYAFSSIIFICVAVVSFLLHGHMRSMEIRFEIWHHAITQMFYKLPLFGWGAGQFKLIFPKIHHEVYGYSGGNGIAAQAHNEYIQGIVEFGLAGMAAIVCFVTTRLKSGFNGKLWIPIAGISIALVNCTVNFLFHTVVAVIVLVYFSIIEVNKGDSK